MKLLAAAILALAVPATTQQAITWRFDNLTRIGGAQVTTIGHPQVVDTSIGKAIHFEGHGDPNPANPQSGNPTGDALFLNTSPLSGFPTYTFEVIFRPSSKGAPAQRFFHMQDANSPSRRMFEIRIVNHQWCLDTVGIDSGCGPRQQERERDPSSTASPSPATPRISTPLTAGTPSPPPTTAKPSAATSTASSRARSPSPSPRSRPAPPPSAPASTSVISSPATSTPPASPLAPSHPQTS